MPADERSLAWFRAAYGEALRSAQALAESLRRVELPASAGALEAADAGTRERIDAFVLRFLRLQDAIGRQLFRALLALEQEEPAQLTQLDVLDRAERMGLVPSVERSTSLRRLRNLLTHEYPERPELRLEALREALAGAPLLLETLARVRERAIHRHGLDDLPPAPA